MGILYLVSTPIGNLEDITLRAKRILSEAAMIACEDTRKTGLLLQRLGLPKKQLLSYYEQNEIQRIPEIIEFLQAGDAALVSNAGTPTISDPGYKLVRECLLQNIKVVPVPGASAVLAALSASGLPTDRFMFLGFLPKKVSKRERTLRGLPKKTTIIIYESPFRVNQTLSHLRQLFGNIKIVLARELTKIHEEIRPAKIKEDQLKGEITLLFRP